MSDGAVVETGNGAGSPDSCGEHEWTVDELHDLVSMMLGDIGDFSAPDFGNHHLDVAFTADGVPLRVEFDLANGDDEERNMQVTLAEDAE